MTDNISGFSERKEEILHLNERIKEFIQLNIEERFRQLTSLIHYIKYQVKPTLSDLESLVNPYFQVRLEYCIKSVMQTKFDIGENNLVDFFEGSYTVIVLARDGRILGISTNPNNSKGQRTDLYEHYQDLTPYALTKAIIELTGWRSGRKVGIASEDNQAFFQKIMGSETVFLGSSVSFVPLLAKDLGEVVFVGASGCEGNTELLNRCFSQRLLKKYYNLGGGTDQVFANELEINLQHPYRGIPIINLKRTLETVGVKSDRANTLTVGEIRKKLLVSS